MLRRLSCCLVLLLPVFQLLAQSCTTPSDSLTTATPTDFWRQQLRFPRVRAARARAGATVAGCLRAHGLAAERLEIFLRLIKTNRELEVWGRTPGAGPFVLLHAYPLAATSGHLGPKRRADDYQVPEGFYEIDRFNPNSSYHLSLGLNYPNTADRALGEASPRRAMIFSSTAARLRWAACPLPTRALRKCTCWR
jgi:hypothetical protein